MLQVSKIISGGQTGVDRAALDVALECDIPCGGWCPAGRIAEDGVIDNRYPLQETPSNSYVQRTTWNVRDSDGTLILAKEELTGGTAKTYSVAMQLASPCYVINLLQQPDVTFTIEWLKLHRIKRLNIAGPRESEHQPIYQIATVFLQELFSKLKSDEDNSAG